MYNHCLGYFLFKIKGCIVVNGKPWNSTEDEIIKKYYPTERSKCALRMEDRKRKSVINRAMQLGVTSKKAAKKWSKEEEDIIREFYPKELNQTVLRLPGRSKVSVSSRARILGVRPTGESKIDSII